MKTFEGKVVAEKVRIGIVAARFNEFIVSKLIGGAEDALLRHGVSGDNIDLAWVPGAFEIPTAAQKMAKSGKYDAVLPAIMTWCAMRPAKELPRWVCKPEFPLCSAS